MGYCNAPRIGIKFRIRSTRTVVESCGLKASRSPPTPLNQTDLNSDWVNGLNRVPPRVEQAHHRSHREEEEGGREGGTPVGTMKISAGLRFRSLEFCAGKKNNEQTKAASTGRPETYTRPRYHRIERALDLRAVIWVWDWDQDRVAADADVLMPVSVMGASERQGGVTALKENASGRRNIAEEVRLGSLGREGSRGFVGKAKDGGGRFVLQPDADVGRREEGKWASTRGVGREARGRRAGTAGEGTSIIVAGTETWREDGIVYAVEGVWGAPREAFPHLQRNSKEEEGSLAAGCRRRGCVNGDTLELRLTQDRPPSCDTLGIYVTLMV
ncbi:hypothetical protein B0H16DRAFT_1464693 [Mycena metata]|uniref:Uncharacterized protein n=1 Tax=Mycena metata TaxID=1033252 RepID=A0AAD7IDR2_9AGAR|nr:hypothetical protein B0H16DRAFT_1464693 [Mycena metata]